MSAINELGQLLGFHASYINALGKYVETSPDALQSLIKAMGYNTDDESALQAACENLRLQAWRNAVSSCEVLPEEADTHELDLHLPATCTAVSLVITLEDGTTLHSQLDTSALCQTGQQLIDGVQYCAYTLPLGQLPEGYHGLTINADGSSYCSYLIVAPQTCYSPSEAAPRKTWGLAAQLYSLSSASSWGMGDFSCLHTLINDAVKAGVDAIGLNPLHPLFPGNPSHRSPYSPTSRCFLNTMYIDVTAVPGYRECEAAQARVNSDDFQAALQQVRASEFIDYGTVGYLKYQILDLLYPHFCQSEIDANSDLAQEFAAFKAEMGQDLNELATYDALYAHVRQQDSNAYGWPQWPAELQDPTSSAVATFITEHADRVDYYAWLQWLAHRQLQAATDAAKRGGMAIGLYLDLAVGCDGGGAEVWANQSAYLPGAAVGAPPDVMNVLGQDWGLTPINPVSLRQQGFMPLVKALRSSMRYAGALRIDHILGLMRQYWVAPGKKADEGVYISFPLADILRVIALESRRQRCVVIGEDLGTVPEGFGEIMAAHGLLSYKVLFFERWESGLFMRPETYTEQSMATISTHDMPTLAGWWTGRDLEWRRNLNLYPNTEMADAEANSRPADRDNLLAAMVDMGLLGDGQVDAELTGQLDHRLALAAQAYLAQSNSAIQLVPFEEAVEQVEQVNIPGTTDEHPNWCRKLALPVEELMSDSRIVELAATLRHYRP